MGERGERGERGEDEMAPLDIFTQQFCMITRQFRIFGQMCICCASGVLSEDWLCSPEWAVYSIVENDPACYSMSPSCGEV